MSVVDSFGHVSPPRFLTAEEFLSVMADAGVECGVMTATPLCADLQELSRACVQFGDRLRVIGLPVGQGAEEQRESVAAQMDAGFAGVRVPEALVAAHPEVLAPVGEAGGALYVDGSDGLRACAESLTDFLDRYPQSVACATYFGGPTAAELIAQDLRVRWLFRHSRFLVMLSPPEPQRAAALKPWIEALLQHTGWERVLWGSDYPTPLWRDETYASAIAWVDTLGPTAAQREACLSGNARRHLFGRPAPRPRPLEEKWCRLSPHHPAPVRVSPRLAWELTEAEQRRLFTAYREWGGEKRGRFGEFLSQRLLDALALPEPDLALPSPARPSRKRTAAVAAESPPAAL
jgi:hypothetical protein